MSKFLVFWLAVLCFVLISVIIILNINTNSTIKCDGIRLDVKHPIIYNIKKEDNIKTTKVYTLGSNFDIIPIMIDINYNYKYSSKDIILRFSKYADEVKIDSKSDSDVCVKIKRKYKFKYVDQLGINSILFIRIIKIKGYTIKIISSAFDKPGLDKQIKIIKNIKITDEAKR